jgi:hypothetical protein
MPIMWPRSLLLLSALLLPALLCNRAAVDTAVTTHADLANNLLEGFHIVGVSCSSAGMACTQQKTCSAALLLFHADVRPPAHNFADTIPHTSVPLLSCTLIDALHSSVMSKPGPGTVARCRTCWPPQMPP